MKLRHSRLKAALASVSVLAVGAVANAQDSSSDDEVIVTGIRQSLENALIEKRNSESLVEVILAEDIGKLPDQNLAEVLENITGIQITREEGVGTGVQIRGTDDNLTLINGIQTVGSGNGRTGISFEDIDASIIAGVEVIKAPQASTIEGAVGGTINLRTIRPLDLTDTLASARVQFEDSSLSSEGLQPRVSGAIGNKWENASGQEIGVVLSGSYTQATNTAFRPRLDRDNVTLCTGDTPSTACPAGATHFLGVQFLNQVQRTQNFETLNFAGSVEAKPTQNLKLFADFIYNDQERLLSGSRAQASNVSRLNGSGDRAVISGGNINFTEFETFDLGVVPGPNGDQDLGTILAVVAGTFSPLQEDAQVNDGRGAPFLRVGSDAGSRLTETTSIRLGGEWEKDALTVSAEYARAQSDTVNPNLSVNLNFINPNSFIAPSGSDFRDENGTPIIFDLRDGFGWGINFDDPFAPTQAQLLDPNNYVVDGSPTYSADVRENQQDAMRLDANYDFADKGLSFISSVDAGYRYSNRSSLRDDRDASRSGSSSLSGSLNAGGISQLLSEIPDNFGSATGNSLSVSGVLQVSPDLTRDAAATVATINAAAAAQGLGPIFTSGLVSSDSAFFDIEEETHAIYGQVNIDTGRLRGNAGLRYVDTSIASTANVFDSDGNPSLTTIDSGYDHFLPTVNLAFDATEDIVLRGSYHKAINRPGFTSITAARTFPDVGGVNSNSVGGNPFLLPEEVDAFDISADWYFAPEAVFSIGYFRKERDGLFGDFVDEPDETGGLRDVTDPCEGGGIFSPGTSPGIFGDEAVTGLGVCVGDQSTFNSENTTTQEGIEVALQYNLGAMEDRLGWASGFGFVANYTYQDESNNSGFTAVPNSRAIAIYDAQGLTNVQRETATLLNLSNHAYNLTGYYEKYGLSARLRYTWRDAFATDDLPGTGNVFTPLGFRGIVEPRGQLNGSLSYDINDHLTVNVDAVNLTESNADVSCVSDGGLPCYQVVTDRRVIFGASYTF